jgi:hypothetical protein
MPPCLTTRQGGPPVLPAGLGTTNYELAVEEPANRRLTVAFDELALVI